MTYDFYRPALFVFIVLGGAVYEETRIDWRLN